MQQLGSQIDEVVKIIQDKCSASAKAASGQTGSIQAGIVLGTGLGALAEKIKNTTIIPYSALPHFPQSTAIGHAGRFIVGELAGVPVAAMQGRFHLYEGYTPQQVALPIRVFKALGAKTLIVTNAAGGVNPQYKCGDIVVLEDHIDLMTGSSLMGVNDEALGPRFPDMCEPYSLALVEKAISIAREDGFTAHRGVYAAMNGPTYETRSEYRFVRMIGADVVGMSTVPEVITAVHAGMQVLGMSTVTNVCMPDILEETSGEEVAQAAAIAETRLAKIVLGILKHVA